MKINYKKFFFYNILIFFIGLIIIQFFFYYFILPNDNYTQIKGDEGKFHSDLLGHHDYLHHIPELNAIYEPDKRYSTSIRHTNSLGWWDTRDFEKKHNNKRIFILGDSQVEGYLRDYDDDPFVNLEKKLNYKNNSKKFEVINTGYSSYSPIIHYVNIRKYLLEYDPSHFIIYIDMGSDFSNDAMYNLLSVKDNNGKIIQIPGINKETFYLIGNDIYFEEDISLFEKIYHKTFISFFIQKLTVSDDSKNEIHFKGKKLSLSKNISSDINLTLSILLDIRNILNDKKINLTLVLIPRIYPLDDINNINFHNSFVELLKSKNFDYIDSLELFDKNLQDKYMTWDKYHISSFYHKKITEILFKKLINL